MTYDPRPAADSPADSPAADPRTAGSDPALHPDTLAVATGRPDRTPDAPLNHPITAASTYVADGPLGYGRYGNPAWTALEEAIGALEGGLATTFSSGMAAAHAVLEALPRGARVVVPANCYLGVAQLVADRAERGDLQVQSVAVDDTAAVLAAAEGADLVWLESPTNPMMEVADLASVGAALAGTGTRLLVDNTFATPILQRPLEVGADLVLHSATKFLSGHSDALLGATVTRDPEIRADLDRVRRSQGAVPGALETYLVLRGLRTLPLRVRHAEATAGVLAGRLTAVPGVERVRYPGTGSLLAIELTDAAAADRLVHGTRLWVNTTSLGGVESTFERRRRWAAELPNVPEGLVRMSVGLEHVEDLWQDLRTALG